ncbi:neuroligin-4, Y-linked [Bactrocera tryoni]|uniref:neuroligin-4, Y-linked n=1 Tax=Bactrocera tryoni TaxID=59916 RepID=UPI001A958796|nr:neuroligin-4, Y-linked [Bactrocera tryoni]XP_039965178.1 neuroligin-4, Y-linked [Bactrocera tryoni]
MIMLPRYFYLLETNTTALSILFLLLACVGGGGGNSGSFATAATATHGANNQNANTRNYSRSGRDITVYGGSSSSSSAVFRALVSASLTDNNSRLQSAAALASEDNSLQMSLVSSPITTASLTANNIFLGPSLSLTSSSAASATSGAGSMLQSASLAGGAGSSSGGAGSSGLSSSGRSSRQNVGGAITNNNVNSHTHGDQLPAQLSSRIIHTRNGAISGVIVQLEGRHLDPVEAYRGIPYASPPVGNLRFMPPVSAAMWSGVKKADRFSPVCPQRLPDIANETAALERMPKGRLEYLKRLLPYLQNQSEDCLYLNIYVPIQVASRDASGSGSSSSGSSNNAGGSNGGGGGQTRYPVVVFVHGESYEWNSGNPYDGSVLASFGQILVVTINYRLGILGFLNANTDRYSKLPANYGLMDIIAALHWLKENIAAFGGDPQSITLAGHGTGAACVHFLISSLAVPEGLLFNRAILMSGSGLAPWSLVSNPAKYAAIVAHHVNCAPDLSHAHLMKCLRDKTLEQLLSVPIRQPEFGFAFGPSIDGVVIDGGDYVPPAPGSAAAQAQASTAAGSGLGGGAGIAAAGGWGTPGQLENIVLMRKTAINKLSRYDLLAGVTRAEAFFSFNSGDVQYGIEADRRSKILKAYVRNTYTYHLNEIFATIVNEYTDWERPVQHPINIRDETLEALSDAQIVAPAAQTVDLHSADHRNSYLYVFDYQTRYGDYPQRQGCIHGEDLPYLFGAPLVGGFSHFTRNYTKTEINLSEVVMLYWSNFVRTGNPNEQMEGEHPGSRQERSRYKTIEWTAYESVHKKYLNFDTKPKLKNHYRAHRLSFWLNLIPDLHKPGGDNVPAAHHQLLDDTDDDVDNNIASDGSVKPLNPPYSPHAGSAALGNFTLFTNQVFSLLNLSSPSSARNGSRYGGKMYGADDNGEAHAAGSGSPPDGQDGFAAYSTALSVTIAIGCSLLILNVLIFAGVYYQRDKTRLSEPRAQTKLKRQENGQMPNNICGDLETLTIHTKNDPATILSHHHALQHQHQLPPPEFADIPHRAPPPPKHLKTLQDASGNINMGGALSAPGSAASGGGMVGGAMGSSGSGGNAAGVGGLGSAGGQGSSAPSGSGGGGSMMGLMPPPHALQVMGNQCGTLTKKSCMKQTQQQQQQQQLVVTHQQHLQNHHNQSMTTALMGGGGGAVGPPPPSVSSAQAHTHANVQQQQQQQQQHHQQAQLQQIQQHPLMDELRV